MRRRESVWRPAVWLACAGTPFFFGCGDDDVPGPTTDAGASGADGGGARDASPLDDGSASSDGEASGDAGRPDTTDAATPGADAGPLPALDPPRTVDAGEVSGRFCGEITAGGTLTVPLGATLEVCAGSTLVFTSRTKFVIDGSVTFAGDARAPIVVRGDPEWAGIEVSGTVGGAFLDVRGATTCLRGDDASNVALTDSTFESCGTSMRLGNGGSFERTVVRGGSTLRVEGGRLRMVDSLVDLGHPGASPDCSSVSGGSMTLEHVRFTGCHCPLHFNLATEPVSVTGSVFDDATYSMMIANTRGEFRDNHFLASSAELQDIGGGVDVDVSGNYYGGGPPRIVDGRNRPSTEGFGGHETFSTEPIAGVGPRTSLR